MENSHYLRPEEILATLRELAAGISAPLWLFGGVCVDFCVGRWTRPHGDIDLNAWAADREGIEADLRRIGYQAVDTGWLTHWHQPATGRGVEIVFLESDAAGEAVLVIPEDATIGSPGRFPTVPGYLVPDRWAQLGDVRFRVSHPLGEWMSRAPGSGVVPGRTPHPKLEHDRRLLEMILSESDRRNVPGR